MRSFASHLEEVRARDFGDTGSHSQLPMGSILLPSLSPRRNQDVRLHKDKAFREILCKEPHYYACPVSSVADDSDEGFTTHDLKQFLSGDGINLDKELRTASTEVIIFCAEIYHAALERFLLYVRNGQLSEESTTTVLRYITTSQDYNVPSNFSVFVLDSILLARRSVVLLLMQRKKIFSDASRILKLYSALQDPKKVRFIKRLMTRNPNNWEVRVAFCFLSYIGAASLSSIVGYLYRKVPDSLKATLAPQHTATNPLNYVNDVNRHEVRFNFFGRAYYDPVPDHMNVDNLIDAINYRVNISHPINMVTMQALRNFVRQELPNDVVPLTDYPMFDDWIESTNYSRAKKNFITELFELREHGKQNSFFVKDESYPKFKAPRCIMNVSQHDKNLEGPIVHAAEEQFHNYPEVLTGKPVKEWGKIVCEAFEPLGPYDAYVTDYSSYEASFSPELKDAVENQFYNRLLANFPEVALKLQTLQNGMRKVVKWTPFGKIEYGRAGGRYSGDQRTYQANTIANIYINRFILRQLGVPYKFFVSGDDGIIALPKGTDIQPIVHLYADLGLKIKLERTTVETSDFCGFSFNREKGYSRLCKNPTSAILKLIHTPVKLSRKKQFSYLKDKALCLLYEFPTDPVLAPACRILYQKLKYAAKAPRDYWTNLILSDIDESIHDLLYAGLDSFTTMERITTIDSLTLRRLSELFLKFAHDFKSDSLISFIEDLDVSSNRERYVFNNADFEQPWL